jgi:hypothetical protein
MSPQVGDLDLAAFIACGGLAAGAELSPPQQQAASRAALQPQHDSRRSGGGGCHHASSLNNAADWSTSRGAHSLQVLTPPPLRSSRDPRVQHAASQDGIRYGVGGGAANPHSPCSSRTLRQCIDALRPGHPGATPGPCQGLDSADGLAVDIGIITDGALDDGFSLGRAITCMSGVNIADSEGALRSLNRWVQTASRPLTAPPACCCARLSRARQERLLQHSRLCDAACCAAEVMCMWHRSDSC